MQLTDANLPRVRGAIQVWWDAWREMRAAQREKDGD